MFIDPGLMLIGIVFLVIGMAVSFRLKSKFAHYSKEVLRSGLTGREIAEKMLRENGIYDVQVTSTPGFLSDHYDPSKRTVNLSESVFSGNNVSAAAVAAHECGHAVQHAHGYKMLALRSAMVPVTQFSSVLMNILVFGFMFGAFMAPQMTNSFLLIYIICQSVVTLFSIITLPVEVDASKRALAWLDSSGLTRGTEHEHAKDALKWAAYTYFVSALAAIATLVYLILQFMGRRDD
jgi:uncharacterized protein